MPAKLMLFCSSFLYLAIRAMLLSCKSILYPLSPVLKIGYMSLISGVTAGLEAFSGSLRFAEGAETFELIDGSLSCFMAPSDSAIVVEIVFVFWFLAEEDWNFGFMVAFEFVELSDWLLD